MRSFRYRVTNWIPNRNTRHSGYNDIKHYIEEAVKDTQTRSTGMLAYHSLPAELDGDAVFWPEYYTKHLIDKKERRPSSTKIGNGFMFKTKSSELRHVYFSEDDLVNNLKELRRDGLEAFMQGFPISHIEFGEMSFIDEDGDEMDDLGLKVFYIYSGEN